MQRLTRSCMTTSRATRRTGFSFGNLLKRLPRPSVRLLKLTDPDKVGWNAGIDINPSGMHNVCLAFAPSVQQHLVWCIQFCASSCCLHSMAQEEREVFWHPRLAMNARMVLSCCFFMNSMPSAQSDIQIQAPCCVGRGGGAAAPRLAVDARPGGGLLPDAARTLGGAAPCHHRQASRGLIASVWELCARTILPGLHRTWSPPSGELWLLTAQRDGHGSALMRGSTGRTCRTTYWEECQLRD